MRRVAVLAVSLLVFGAGQPQARQAKNAEIQKVADAFVAAWNKADAKGLAALHAQDAIRATPEGLLVVGRAAIEKSFTEAMAGPLKGTKLVVTTGDERAITADLIVSSGTWEVTGATAPAGAATSGVYVNTMIRQGGRWLIASSAPIGVPKKP